MKRFVKNCLIFVVPISIYSVIIFIVNPFNYNNYHILNIDGKAQIAEAIEPHLFKIINYENNPTKNILLGDSRTNDFARQIKSDSWTNLGYGGGSIKEIIQTFWWADEIHQLDTVLIGINLNLYNTFNKRFWVEETLERKKNFFSYAFSKYAFKASILTIKSVFSNVDSNFGTPSMSKDAFWEYQLTETANKFYEKFEYPKEYYKELEKISIYCRQKHIKLIFWIPPTHIEFQNLKKDYRLENIDEMFIADLKKIGELYDFDFDSEITRNKEDYPDPMHFNSEIGLKIYKDIFYKENNFSRHYDSVEFLNVFK